MDNSKLEPNGWIEINDGCETPKTSKPLWLTIEQKAGGHHLRFTAHGRKLQKRQDLDECCFCTPDMFELRESEVDNRIPYKITAWRYAEPKPEPFIAIPE